MMTVQTTKYDVAEHLTTPEFQAEYLAEAFETGEDALIRKALGNVARARGMAAVAADANLSRQSIYKSLSETGDPKFSTLKSILDALGMEFTVRLKPAKAA